MAHLLAYADRWSIAPRETIRFFVSSPNAPTYNAQLLRLLQPEAGPQATQFHPEPLEAPLNRQHCGRAQTLPIGSFAIVPDFSSFARLDQFTLAAAVFPTTSSKGRQALIGTWREKEQTGVGLEIGADQALNLRVGTGDGDPFVLSTGTALASHRWYRVAVIFSGEAIFLLQEALNGHDFRFRESARVSAPRRQIVHAADAALTMAAWCAGAGDISSPWNGRQFACHFNGRIDGPRIVIGAPDPSRIAECIEPSPIEHDRAPIFAAWDFGRNIPDETILDVGPHGLHGQLINSPTRGVTGHNWSGEAFNWRCAPHEYGAIHFHDDDLTDASWLPDFEFQVPGGMRSGIYAVRLTDGREDAWVPFVVRPPCGEAGSDAAILLPTMTYIAYLNHRARFMSVASERLHGRLKVLDATDIAFIETPEVGLSTYDRHTDGSGVTCSSRLRPATNMRPTGHLWNFSLDLFIVDWLESIGSQYDVITDEDLHEEGAAILRSYRVVITGSHPEYVSKNMLNALEIYLQTGGRLIYVGGNGFYWRAVFHPEKDGLIEVRRSEGVRSWDTAPGEQATSFTGENSGIWRKNGRPPQSLVGVGYIAQGFNKCSYYVRTPSAENPRISWAFDGVIGKAIGNESVLFGGAAGFEIDSVNLDLGTPEHALVIARSENHTNAYELASEEVLTPHGATDGMSTDDIHADMVFFETPGGGAVFSTGSIAYAAALSWNGFNNDLCRLTTNVLRRFRQDRPFRMPPRIPKPEISRARRGLEKFQMDALTIVSLEGNWDAAINARRLDLAGTAFRDSNADFVIVSGTHEPGTSASNGVRSKKLGERNTQTLRDVHDIDSALIIPAHAFPFEFTYTTIEAFGNACMIGWLMSGFERQSDPHHVDFAPISSGVHCQRVHVLNVRACHALKQFNVETTVKRQQPLGPDEPDVINSEVRKLDELTRVGGIIATGRWFHRDEEWSFDDPWLMRATMVRMMSAVLPALTENQIRQIAGVASVSSRYAIMQMLCEVSADRQLGPFALDCILTRTAQRFAGAFDDSSVRHIAEYFRRGSA